MAHLNIINPGTQGSKKGYVLKKESDEEKRQREEQEEKQLNKALIEEEKWKSAEEVSKREYFPVTWELIKINDQREEQIAGRIRMRGQNSFVIPYAQQEKGCRDVYAGQRSSCKLATLTAITSSYNYEPVYPVNIMSTRETSVKPAKIQNQKSIDLTNLRTVQRKSPLSANEVNITVEGNDRQKNKTVIRTGSKKAADLIKEKLFAETGVRWFSNQAGEQLSILEVLASSKIKKIKGIIRSIKIEIEVGTQTKAD